MDVQVFIGRFQPPHRGHRAIIEMMIEDTKYHPIVLLIDGKKSSQDKERNPLLPLVRHEVLTELPVQVMIAENPYVGLETISELYVIRKVYQGEDRDYQPLLASLGLPAIIEELPRTPISSTQMRTMARAGMFEEFVENFYSDDEETARQVYEDIRNAY